MMLQVIEKARRVLAAGLQEVEVFGGSPVVVMFLALAVFGLFVFSIVSQYLSERRRS